MAQSTTKELLTLLTAEREKLDRKAALITMLDEIGQMGFPVHVTGDLNSDLLIRVAFNGAEEKGPSPVRVMKASKPKAEKAPQPEPAEEGMTIRQRRIADRIALLPYDSWTAEDDLVLIERLARGDKIPDVAAALDIGREDCIARYKLLFQGIGVDDQPDLLTVLRDRARAAAA